MRFVKQKDRKGQATLAMVLLIGGITVFIGAGLAFVVLSFLNSSFGFQASERAFAMAKAGTNDAMIKLIRNKDFSAGGGGYTVPNGNNSATVTITQGSPTADRATIVSRAVISGYERTLQTVVWIDEATGEISMVESKLLH